MEPHRDPRSPPELHAPPSRAHQCPRHPGLEPRPTGATLGRDLGPVMEPQATGDPGCPGQSTGPQTFCAGRPAPCAGHLATLVCTGPASSHRCPGTGLLGDCPVSISHQSRLPSSPTPSPARREPGHRPEPRGEAGVLSGGEKGRDARGGPLPQAAARGALQVLELTEGATPPRSPSSPGT